jgi:hypothetical protein
MKGVCVLLGMAWALSAATDTAAQDSAYYERDGQVVVEAEDFSTQSESGPRHWYLVNASNDGYADDEIQPGATPLAALPDPDGDGGHAHTAGGGAYIEILPDTRRSSSDKLLDGLNFSNTPTGIALLSYRVHFTNPGRYYVWARAFSTGSEDNGVHVGLDGQWPASGQRMQWCLGRFSWYWSSAQRTAAEHCGVARRIYLDVEEAGWHTVQFSMREDGFEMDRWLMTTDRLIPVLNFDMGPDAAPYKAASTAVRRDSWGKVKGSGINGSEIKGSEIKKEAQEF